MIISRFADLFYICSEIIARTKGDRRGAEIAARGLYFANMLINIPVMQSLDTAHNASFGALADPTRRAILTRLARGEASVREVAEPFAISAPAISRHLKVLEDAALIGRRKQGQTHILSLNPAGLKSAQAWLDQTYAFWSGALDRLDAHLKKDPK
jgi:DNA-binding transcriptional ArsR family regulator